MAPYFPVSVARSDGVLEVVTRNGGRELNQPTAEQLKGETVQGRVDCYRKLETDEPKAVDWRRKIGGMLMHHLGGKEHSDRNYILREFPEGYTLWEHVKYKTKDAIDDDKKEKSRHAAGAYERQDAYLYGHPQGRKKRFRSPADFFPHLLWLAADKESNPRNCSCKLCSPDNDDDVPTESTNKALPQPPTAAPALVPKATLPKPAIPTTTAAPATSRASVPAKFRKTEQQLDNEPNGNYIYRPGELVWFNKGTAWGLAVISRRESPNNKPRYLLQPLSHPLNYPPYQIKDNESEIRPWLAWSVPAPTHLAITGMSYDDVPWQRVVNGDLGPGDAEVDGSILAAKSIDASYSLFDRIIQPMATQGELYNGMFLGAEKVWISEPVRLRASDDDIVVLIIQKLIEQKAPAPSTASTVTFVGDVYKLVEMPTPAAYKEPTNAHLPERMVSDLSFRNNAAASAGRNIWYEWRLLEPAARKDLSDVKGRWYESQKLLPILRGAAQYQQDVAQGNTTDSSFWMNGRCDNLSIGAGIRRKNRLDTLSKAVPSEFKVSRGLDGPPEDDMFPSMAEQNFINIDHTLS